jgi:folate-binding protein YgfZ
MTTKDELTAIRESAGIFPLDDRAFLRITGEDATRWLNGMVTNSIQSLAPGEGNYNFLLNAQGRIQGDCTIYRLPETAQPVFLLETDAAQIDTIEPLLDKFIIMDDVQLERGLEIEGIDPTTKGIGLLGIRATEFLTQLVSEMYEVPLFSDPQPGKVLLTFANGSKLSVIAPPATKMPYYELWDFNDNGMDIAKDYLTQDLGAAKFSSETLEAFRILEGRPRFGKDIRERDLPQETNQTHALHFTKGCYLGQEIVERIHSRGQVHRTFTGFRLTALPTTLPAPLTTDGKPTGELTSAVIVPLPEGDAILALGYARREALDRNTPLTYEGGTATSATLPFTPS